MHASPANESVTSVAAAAKRRRRALRSRCSILLAAAGLAIVSSGAMAATDDPKQPKLSKSTIKAAQKALHVHADGVIGPKTRRSIKRFQRRHDLVVDGILGPQTLRALRVKRRVASSRSSGSTRTILRRIAECESGGDPEAISASGKYRGKYQFSRKTWRSVGGTGDPAQAPEPEQDLRALKLYRRDGAAPWPNCA